MPEDQDKSAAELLEELRQLRRENVLMVALMARLAKNNLLWQTTHFGETGIAIDTPDGHLVWQLPAWAMSLFHPSMYDMPTRKQLSSQSSETRCKLIELSFKNIDKMLDQAEKSRRQ